ncbi:MAG: hypothetical protein AAGI23_11830 [Bacteroidota bacterium]
MANLILHVGAGKCGSSSIQQFYIRNQTVFQENVRLYRPPIAAVEAWAEGKSGEGGIGNWNSKKGTLIISQEYFFRKYMALPTVIAQLNTAAFGEKMIIGYCRRQSDYVVSAYGQWGFRHSGSLTGEEKRLKEHQLNPLFFTGSERHLINLVLLGDVASERRLKYKHITWQRHFDEIKKIGEKNGFELKVGLLPNKVFSHNLILDFCEKANLHILPEYEQRTTERYNVSYDKDIMEGMSSAVRLGYRELPVQTGGGHFERLSERFEKRKPVFDLQDALKAYIDTCYWEANQAFCEAYQLNADYFKPTQIWTKADIIELIRAEEEKRRADPEVLLEEYQHIAAKLASKNWDLINQVRAAEQKTPAFFIKKVKAKLRSFGW